MALITNPSFEANGGNGTPPTGWTQDIGTGTSANVDTTHAADGTYSLELVFNGSSAAYGVEQTVTGLVAGHTYWLRGGMYRATTAGTCHVDVYESGSDVGQLLNWPASNIDNVFSEREVSFVYAGSGTASVRVYGDGTPAGHVWVDNLALVDLTDTATLTESLTLGLSGPAEQATLTESFAVTKIPDYNPTSAFGSSVDRVQALVPKAVWGEPDSRSFMQVAAFCLGQELQGAWQAVAWITAQAYPQTADENGLCYWEQLLGLPIAPPNLTTEQRRQVVLARRHVAGPVQIPSVQALLAQYVRGETAVAWSPRTATLTVTFTSTLGVPDNLPDVQRALAKYLPAWVLVQYQFTFLTWDQVTATGRTWDQITTDAFTWDQLATEPASAL